MHNTTNFHFTHNDFYRLSCGPAGPFHHFSSHTLSAMTCRSSSSAIIIIIFILLHEEQPHNRLDSGPGLQWPLTLQSLHTRHQKTNMARLQNRGHNPPHSVSLWGASNLITARGPAIRLITPPSQNMQFPPFTTLAFNYKSRITFPSISQ